MALPYLIKRIYNNASEEVIRRSKKIHQQNFIELLEFNDLLANVVFRVRDDGYHTYFKVYISQFRDDKTLNLRCTCPYNLSEICRHKAAALFHLQELLDKNLLGDKELIYNQKHTVVKMRQLELKVIRLLSSAESFEEAENYLRTRKAKIIEAKDEKIVAEVAVENQTYQLRIQKNEERNFDTSCICKSETKHPLCLHKTILLLQLLQQFGPNYFDSIRNWDGVKNKLLAIYGYSLSDNLSGKFEFAYQEGRPFLRVLDNSIKRVDAIVDAAITQKIEQPVLSSIQEEEPDTILPRISGTTSKYKLGLVVTFNPAQYPFVQLDAIQGEPDEAYTKYIGRSEKLDLQKFIETNDLSSDDIHTLAQLRKFLPLEINKYLSRNSPFSSIWENIIQPTGDDMPEETKQLILEYLHPKWKKVFDDTTESNYNFYLSSGKSFTTAALEQIDFSGQPIYPAFFVSMVNNQYKVECKVKLPEGYASLIDNEIDNHFLFKYQHHLFLWDKPEDILVTEPFTATGFITIEADKWAEKLNTWLLPLSKEYDIQFGNVRREEISNEKPSMKILLQEKSEYLVFEPVFNYNGFDILGSDKQKIIFLNGGSLFIINRNAEAEKELMQKLENLHSHFIKPAGSNALALKGADVLKNNWFFLFIDAVKEMNVDVAGLNALKKFRFNTAKPSTKIFISSNTDWFDAKVEIQFGEQKVTVADVKQALASNQQFVPLGDGTLGILPEEWIRKYSLLFKVGEGRQDDMKLNKYQFSVIEDLYNQRDEEELFVQLEEKYDKLRYNHEIKKVPVPKHLQSVLRPYQESGFQWLNYLQEVHCGGILADDMGLGKTLQALTFMQQFKEENGTLKALVVCPTTLMFNWKNEIQKFTPALSEYVHHGSVRVKDNLTNTKNDITITTYGTLRSDIKQFMEINWDYVVLDESQAIKNPSSKVTKAACLLKAKSRLCLSGTPLQNNTFDIFAQMNFLNPGMLGSMEFFKNEFAVPIDKFGEKDQKEHLRKLLYPFILRRTKEQVAKDLPEKQEMVLFCEMGEEQRNIYEAFRNDFREKILGVVQEQGIQKSQLTILQGLMKLRQICDSPAIMKEHDGERYPNVSVKLEEIGREISENISNHKALVFSQFLGMLALIKSKLKELEVDYEYFDGSSSAAERERAITRFQNDENCRVFLISLKAGGVGLNLTAADYVYIVDPWWNPAVEQQAIDRTHRIGQTKNIFAYRMICTDTVEDKILKLQERKKALAKDIITDDEGFVKSLTKEDVEYLFS